MKYLLKTQLNIIKNPCIDIQLVDNITSKRQDFEALIDTGFNGWISFDLALASILGLESLGLIKTINADGQEILNPVFVVDIQLPCLDLASTSYRIKCIAKANQVDEVIIGSKFLDHFCNQNKLKLSLDYPSNEIYFEDL